MKVVNIFIIYYLPEFHNMPNEISGNGLSSFYGRHKRTYIVLNRSNDSSPPHHIQGRLSHSSPLPYSSLPHPLHSRVLHPLHSNILISSVLVYRVCVFSYCLQLSECSALLIFSNLLLQPHGFISSLEVRKYISNCSSL